MAEEGGHLAPHGVPSAMKPRPISRRGSMEEAAAATNANTQEAYASNAAGRDTDDTTHTYRHYTMLLEQIYTLFSFMGSAGRLKTIKYL